MSFKAGTHQLKMTNSIERGARVKSIIRETRDYEQLTAIHYFFATRLQETSGVASPVRLDAGLVPAADATHKCVV